MTPGIRTGTVDLSPRDTVRILIKSQIRYEERTG